MGKMSVLRPLAGFVLGAIATSNAAWSAEVVLVNRDSSSRMLSKVSLAPSASQTAESFRMLSQQQDRQGTTHARFQQQYLGFDVIGGAISAHGKATDIKHFNTDALGFQGSFVDGLRADLGQVPQGFKANAAKVLARFTGQFKNATQQAESVKPVVFVDEESTAHWAYQVGTSLRFANQAPQKPHAIIDAASGKTLVSWDEIKHEKSVIQGRGFGGNPKLGEYQFGGDRFPFLEMTRDSDTRECSLINPGVKVIDMDKQYGGVKDPMTFACQNPEEEGSSVYWSGYYGDGYDRINGAFSPTNDALYYGYVINHMYQDWYGMPALKKSNGEAMQLVMRVHYGDNYENAFWDGKQMTFGDGESFFYPLVSLGVAAHEISHGFTEQHSDLAYYSQSGGLNESFSDMAAMAAEFFSTGKPTWMIGSEIVKEDSGLEALRFMDVPSRDGESIDSAEDYHSGLDVHYSSGVFNRFFYLLATSEGWDTRKAFDVMVKANSDYWTAYTSFQSAGCGVISAAKDLGYDLNTVNEALIKIALKPEMCR